MSKLNHVTCIGCTYNCVETDYPVAEVLEGYWNHCHEIVVVDAGSTDGTLELLQQCQRVSPIPFIIDAHFPYWDKSDLGWLIAARQRGFDLATSKWVWIIDMDEFLASPIETFGSNVMRIRVFHFEVNPWQFTDQYTYQDRIVCKETCTEITDHFFKANCQSHSCGASVLHYSQLRHRAAFLRKAMRIWGGWHKRDDVERVIGEWETGLDKRNIGAHLYTGPIPESAKRWLLQRNWTEEDLNERPIGKSLH